MAVRSALSAGPFTTKDDSQYSETTNQIFARGPKRERCMWENDTSETIDRDFTGLISVRGQVHSKAGRIWSIETFNDFEEWCLLGCFAVWLF
jgi:hypothetical protein